MLTLVLLTALAADGQSQLRLVPGWKATGELVSEYATQAAAADEHRIYVVSNTHVAVYDRATGRRLAVSDGPAEHLNSAFVKDGKVYCAHSNYPNKPDAGDIRVYDPQTNRLTVFHQFRDPPGSPVWCVHDGTHWWCCFAHYQKDNARTLLIRYGEGFREQARWTFPRVVVDDWDGMSASGGLFDGETLLVSHHHFPVLYRLKVPPGGGELSFVEALTCPFPGQGIARDPKTGGLVGIDRSRRKVVFAEKVR